MGVPAASNKHNITMYTHINSEKIHYNTNMYSGKFLLMNPVNIHS